MIINISYDLSVNGAPAGFKTAVGAVVQFFQNHFFDPVTITINVGYGVVANQGLGSGALGASITHFNSYSYSQIKNALASDAKTADDHSAAASLPTSDPISGGHDYWMATAEAKALGLFSSTNNIDGYVGFSSTPNIFDYDKSNGVTAGQYDFYGVVAHEISEVMGRQMMTGEAFAGTTAYEPLDLFHYSSAGQHTFSGTTAGYFSIDGGQTNLNSFNTNSTGDFGDWAASAGNDAFLAFSHSGVVNAITATDLKAMDILGWDANSPPVITSSNVRATPGQVFAASSLVSASDPDNDALVYYAFWDTTVGSGYFDVNGAVQDIGFVVSTPQLSQVHYHVGPSGSSDHIYASVFDGTVWATATQFDVSVVPNSPPVITSSNVTASPGQVIAASSLVTASDPDNDALVYYAFWDTTVGSGYFDVNGAVQDIGFVVSTPQLSQVHYHVGPSGSSDHIYASVFDGTVWATATQFDVSVLPNSPPVITSSNVTASLGQVFAASSLVSASDPDNDALVYYAFWDTTVGSGYFDVNGAVQDIGFVVSTPQLSQVHYHAGPSGSSDHIYASVFDGTIWATNTQFEVSVPSNTGFAVEADADASLVLAPVTGLQFCTVSTSGNDVMSGSDGSDTFVFHPNFGQDTITNFDLANDAIRFDSSIFQSVSAIAAHTYDSPVGAIIIDGQGDSVTLVGVTAAQFAAHQTDFHLL